MKKKGLIIIGLTIVLGISGAAGVCAATKKIIKIEDGKRTEINVGQSQEFQTEGADPAFGGAAVPEDYAAAGTGTEDSAGGEMDGSLEPGRIWGNVLEKMDGSFLINSQVQEGYQGEIVIHLDPDNTLILDSTTGFPVSEDEIAAGKTLYVYIRPAMTMSLPPQTTADVVLVNTAQDAAAPLYVTVAEALAASGEGEYLLKTRSGETIIIPADCPITPYLTRQMVRLEDIDAGRKCLIWMGADNRAERIVLFNE